VLISDKCTELSRQLAGWTIQKGKPSDEDWGYCECMCLLLSELQRKRAIESVEKKEKDYNNKK
jgi:hypothetical protein